MNIAIVGAGAWGTALAVTLSRNHRVALWARNPVLARQLAGERLNGRYLPEIELPSTVFPTDSLAEALSGAELLLIATPTAGLREMFRSVKDHAAPVIWACKGFEADTATLPHRMAIAELGAARPCGVLSGPSFALEVARGQPTALTMAASDAAFARETARALHHSLLRIYYSTDVIGVETGGAVKNVMAIATGICDGLKLGLNARAALITRGLAEITRLGLQLGGSVETFMGLAGAGDLILTCTGDLSRNRRVGLQLAGGRTLAQILADLRHVAEGVHSARAVQRLARESGVDMPITDGVCSVLFGGVGARDAVQQLLARDPKSES
ncbi:MAG: NAD(P)-dependent glycerol-3-phosphate dehydrogenase [Betaproteobacteria bacterium]|nr:NAD(P)-dependent glycerol-3-phosphate dehydrogenase [Betaproteobacteria bacterium]